MHGKFRSNFFSGAPAAQRSAKRSPILICETKGNTWVDFLMVIMASGIACGRVRTMAMTTELRKMAAILQIMGWQICNLGLLCTSLILDIHVMINWHLSKQGICWPVSHDHIAGSSLQLVEVECFLKLTTDQVLFVFYWIAGSCLVNLLKTVQDCSEAC